MRIVYDHQVTSLQDAGGASRYHYELARHISKNAKVEIGMYLGLTGNVHPYALLRQSGVRVVSFHSSLRPGLARYAINELLTGVCFMATRQKWDVYHSTLYRAMPTLRARAIVVTNHDCTQERFPRLFPDAQRIIRWKSRLFQKADMIICPSRSTQRDLLHFHDVNAAKTRVIHQGLSSLANPGPNEKSTMALPGRGYLLYVGARHAYKNYTGLLQAFSDSGVHKDFDLLLVGGGPLSSSELKQIQALGLAAVVKHKPVVGDVDLAEAYRQAALFVYPSLYEGFGFPPLEAMCLNCPVLAANCSSIPEVCGDAPYYFDPEDASSLGAMLVHALNAPDRSERITAGHQKALQYQWSECANNTLEAYHEL
jgi:glycosyltransferase involved in cell wall biosynthesis